MNVLWLVSHRISQAIDASPTMKAITQRDARSGPRPGSCRAPRFTASYSPDSTTAGMESRKREPGRGLAGQPAEQPGGDRRARPRRARGSARAPARCRPRPRRVVVICSSSRSRVPTRSAAEQDAGPARSSVAAMSQRLRAPVSIWWLKIRPNTPTGTVARMRYQPSLYSSVPRTDGVPEPRNQATVTCSSSRQKYRTIAAVVPSWTMAVNGGARVVRGAAVEVPAEQRRDDAQVGGRRDRQELGESLDDAEDDRLEERHSADAGLARGLRRRCAGRRAARRCVSPYGGQRQRGDPGLGERGHPVGDALDRAEQRRARRRTRAGRPRRRRRSRGPGTGPGSSRRPRP